MKFTADRQTPARSLVKASELSLMRANNKNCEVIQKVLHSVQCLWDFTNP